MMYSCNCSSMYCSYWRAQPCRRYSSGQRMGQDCWRTFKRSFFSPQQSECHWYYHGRMCRYLRKYHHWQHLVCWHYWRPWILQRESILCQSPSKEIAIADNWFHNIKLRAIPVAQWVSSETVSTIKSVSSVSAPALDAQEVYLLDLPGFPATVSGFKTTLELNFKCLCLVVLIFHYDFIIKRLLF